jgi:hypothetical protein
MPDTDGNALQTRAVAEQVGKIAAKMAVEEFVHEHPELTAPKPDIPGPLKWAAGIISALLAMGVGGTVVWLMTTVNEMQVTIARIDERMANQTTAQGGQYEEINRRLTRLEALAAENSK